MAIKRYDENVEDKYLKQREKQRKEDEAAIREQKERQRKREAIKDLYRKR